MIFRELATWSFRRNCITNLRVNRIPESLRVAVFCGENARANIFDTAQRICESKGISLNQDCNVLWSFTLPPLKDAEQRLTLKKMLHNHGIQVVIFDPLYLFFLDQPPMTYTGNLFDVGPWLSQVTASCLEAGATPIFVHHTTKSGSKLAVKTSRPLQLDDLAFSGISEFFRQWILVNPIKTYCPRIGSHKLLMTVGGNAGHWGSWELAVQEGQIKNDLSGRYWRVKLRNLGHPFPSAEAIQPGQIARSGEEREGDF